MKFKITHQTTYQYASPVSTCHNVMMLTPRESPWIETQSHRINVRPNPADMFRRRDWFGNLVHSFSLEENHRQLTISAISRVTVQERKLASDSESRPWDEIASELQGRVSPGWFEVIPFVYDSRRIRRSDEFREYAETAFASGRPILEAMTAFNAQVHRQFRYDQDATQVNTPAESAFEAKHGVCQDFAHVVVACLRSLGLPARYVSGYLRTVPPPGQERLIGADQSHAWVGLYCGPELGWVDFDPTNNCMARLDHIPIGWGRDYSDVVPIKGMFLGGGEPTLQVSVDVEPQEEN